MKTINLTGAVGWEITAKFLNEKLKEGDREDVLLKVNSPGGFVFEGFELFNLIKDYQKETGKKVNVLINGIAASAASYFIMAADKITVRENSVLMIHKAWSFAIGNSDDLSKESDILSGIDSVLAKAYAKKTGMKLDKVLDAMKNETWLFGDDIKNEKFADDSEPITETADEIEVFTHAEAKAKVSQVKAKLESYYSNLKDQESKAAAWISDFKNSITGQPEINNKKEVSKMDLNEFLKQNPEAMAQLEASSHFQAAIDKGIKAEKERINELLAVAGIKFSDSVKNAIDNNLNSGDFAKAEMIAQNELRNKNNEVQNLGNLMASSQIPKDSKVDEPKKGEIALTESEVIAMAKNYKKNQGAK